MQLAGKRIVVTGATGIAAAGASLFDAYGAEVFVISKEASECRAIAGELGCGWAAADLTEETDTEAAFAEAEAALGGLDGLFAVAGGSGRSVGDGPLHEIPLSGWDTTIAMNLTTTFLSVREAIRNMLDHGGGGSVVVTSSVLALDPSPRFFATHAYSSAKGAQLSLVRASAAKYATEGIRVNALAPGLVATPMAKRAAGDPRIVEYASGKQPLVDGLLEPVAIAEAAAFLLSDSSRAITGQIIEVDGGWSVSEVADGPE